MSKPVGDSAMTTTTTRPKRPAKPKLTDAELATVERAKRKLLNPSRPGAGVTAAYEDAALKALAVLVHYNSSPDRAVDPWAVIANEIGVPQPPAFLAPRVDDTGLHVGLVEELRVKLAQTELIPVVPGDRPERATQTQQLLPTVKLQRRWPFSRKREEPWP